MERSARVALERAQRVEPEGTADVHDAELRRRLHACNASGHLADGAVRDGEKQQPLARHAKSGACRHEPRV